MLFGGHDLDSGASEKVTEKMKSITPCTGGEFSQMGGLTIGRMKKPLSCGLQAFQKEGSVRFRERTNFGEKLKGLANLRSRLKWAIRISKRECFKEVAQWIRQKLDFLPKANKQLRDPASYQSIQFICTIRTILQGVIFKRLLSQNIGKTYRSDCLVILSLI